jgi:hypothetical protein
MSLGAPILLAATASMGAHDKLTPADARAVALEAYVFGLPPVYLALSRQIIPNVARLEGARAPSNHLAHFHEFPDPSNRTVVIWNVAAFHSIGRRQNPFRR